MSGIVQIIDNNIKYELPNDLTAKIIESPDSSGDVVIGPSIEYKGRHDINEIGEKAFFGSNVKSISFESDSKMKTFGAEAFSHSDISSIFIPSSLEKLDDNWCFEADKLKQITADPKNSFFKVEEGFLYYKNKEEENRELLFAPKEKYDEFSLPRDVKRIGIYSFSNVTSLTKFNSRFPALQVIDKHSFFNCEKLTYVKIENANELKFDICCFSECKNLISVEISCKTIHIGKFCFNNCSSLKEFKIKIKETADEIEISENAFNGCTSLEQILINAKTITIGEKCFTGLTNLKSIGFVFDSVPSFGENYIQNCPNLNLLTITSRQDMNFQNDIFKGPNNLKHVFIESEAALKIMEESFNDQQSLIDLNLIGTIVEINDKCFKNCFLLKKIVIEVKTDDDNDNNPKLGNKCFSEATNLEEILFRGGNIKISDQFNQCSKLKNLNFIDVKSVIINKESFINFNSLEIIDIKSDSVELNTKCFYKSSIKEVKIVCKNLSIENNCFEECESLATLQLQSSGKIEIEDHSFYKCCQLTEIDFKAGLELIIGSNCFYSTKVARVSLNGKSIDIGEQCFKNCTSLNYLSIQSKQEAKLESCAFDGCSNLNDLNVKAERKIEAGVSCFRNAKNLHSFTFSSQKISINAKCFKSCPIENIKLLSVKKFCYYTSSFDHFDRINFEKDETIDTTKNDDAIDSYFFSWPFRSSQKKK